MFKQLLNLSKVSKEREDGQGLVEYALILVLVSVVVVVVLSQMGPAVGNIFSGVVGALNGGVVAGEEDEEEENCVQAHAGNYLLVPSNGRLPASSLQYSDSECTTVGFGTINIDSVKVPGGSSVAQATNACQSHYGKTLRFANDPSSEIWAGTGFWYCTP